MALEETEPMLINQPRNREDYHGYAANDEFGTETMTPDEKETFLRYNMTKLQAV